MGPYYGELDRIRLFCEDGDVVAQCVICDGRLRFMNSPLSMMAEAMLDHLMTNHADRYDRSE